MTRHLLRLIWNRKRSNFLMMVEIFFSFLGCSAWCCWPRTTRTTSRQPLGYTIDRVWSIRIDRKENDDEAAVKARHRATFRQLLNAVREMPQVEVAAASVHQPVCELELGRRHAAPGRAQARLRDEHRHGRLSGALRDAPSSRPLVHPRRRCRHLDADRRQRALAREIFGDGDAVGTRSSPKIAIPNEPPRGPGREAAKPGAWSASSRTSASTANSPRPRTSCSEHASTTEFRGQAVPGAVLVRGPERRRRSRRRSSSACRRSRRTGRSSISGPTPARDKLVSYTRPLVAVGIVAGFLLLMVALGLTGVVWQNVTQRIREIGLRRAKGARIENIHRQILGELVVMTSLALLVGVLLVAQVPLLPLPTDLDGVPAGRLRAQHRDFGRGHLCAHAALRLVSGAARDKIQPAEALHYE